MYATTTDGGSSMGQGPEVGRAGPQAFAELQGVCCAWALNGCGGKVRGEIELQAHGGRA